MFDERELVGKFGPIKKDQIKAGPVGQFNYEHGYHFSVTPDRIDVRHSGREVLPNPLLENSQLIARQLEPIQGIVSGVGINCDAAFHSSEIGKTGIEFCQTLTKNQLSQYIFEGYSNITTLSVATAFQGTGKRVQQYNVRFEPDQNSERKDLKVALNAHQNVTTEGRLSEKLDGIAIKEVRTQIERIHRQILSSGDV